jgi:ABC-type xylose transport system permease subunit
VNLIIVIVGWLINLLGLFGIASPHWLIDAVLGWPTAVRFYSSVLTRVVLGVLFIFAAPRCRLPRLIYVLGAIILLIGIVLFFLGADRVDKILHWFVACLELCIRFIYLVGILFGSLLIYAGSKRR